MTDPWGRYDLEPYPRLAPPYSHVLGRGRLVVAEFNLETAKWEGIDDYWRVDTAATVVSDLRVRRGDLILWVGPDDRGGGARAWPVSLVLEASRKTKGRQTISALAFDDHKAIFIADLPTRLRGLLAVPAVVTGNQRRLLLDLWELDVLCPSCGGLGLVISYGLPVLSSRRDEVVILEPSDAGYAMVSEGCVVGTERYSCRRCGKAWPSRSDFETLIGDLELDPGDDSAWHPPQDGTTRPDGLVQGGPDVSTRSS